MSVGSSTHSAHQRESILPPDRPFRILPRTSHRGPCPAPPTNEVSMQSSRGGEKNKERFGPAGCPVRLRHPGHPARQSKGFEGLSLSSRALSDPGVCRPAAVGTRVAVPGGVGQNAKVLVPRAVTTSSTTSRVNPSRNRRGVCACRSTHLARSPVDLALGIGAVIPPEEPTTTEANEDEEQSDDPGFNASKSCHADSQFPRTSKHEDDGRPKVNT